MDVLQNGNAGHDRTDDPVLPTVTSSWINRLILLGTGTSGQVPAIACLLPTITSSRPKCAACFDAVEQNSKNRRGCTSAAIVGGPLDDESLILIDCGPTFYSSAIQHFAKQRLRRIDAVLLTHAHADAILGLDNLRSWTMGGVIQNSVDVYCTSECFQTINGMFPYLVEKTKATGGGGVGDVKFHIIDANESFDLPLLTGKKIKVTPLPAHHGYVNGEPFQCLGYRIDSLSYLSDCHAVPSKTAALMGDSQVVVIDALNPYRHASHFSLSQGLSFILSMPGSAPRLALLTDLTHNLEHRQTENEVQEWKRQMQDHLTSLHVMPSIEKAGRGEGGGCRWWMNKWKEDRAERHVKGGLLASILSESKSSSRSAESQQIISSAASNVVVLPDIHVSWDGMVIHFAKSAE